MKQFKALILNDWTIAIVVHVLILVIFALIYFQSPAKAVSTVIELFTESYSQPEIIPDNPGQPANESRNTIDYAQQPDKTLFPLMKKDKNTNQTPPNANRNNAAVTAPVTNADPVLPPTGGQNIDNKTTGTAPSSSFLSKLKGKLRGNGDGGNSFEFDDGDGSVTILSKVLPNPTITDYGKVTLQFKIKADGTVLGDSIIPVLVDDASYTRDAVNALKQWKFEVKRFNPNQIYKISFIFKPI